MTSLEERVARAMCAANSMDADERMPNDGPRWRYYVPCARAAIAVCAEEMAKIADGHALAECTDCGSETEAMRLGARSIASAIRYIGEKG